MGATLVKLVGHPYTQSMKAGEGVGKKWFDGRVEEVVMCNAKKSLSTGTKNSNLTRLDQINDAHV